MKQNLFTVLLVSTVLWGCSESSSKKSSSSSTNNASTACLYDYYTNPSCPGYGSTSGSTTSGSTTGSTGGGSYGTIPSDNNWASLYPNGEPQGNCSSPTGSGYPLRKGTITMAGGQMYSPGNPWSAYSEDFSQNVSYFLMSPQQAKMFIDTDAVLRVRVKPRPQPKAPKGSMYCFGRVSGQSPLPYGYTSLRYTIAVKAINADGSLGPFMGTTTLTTGVNSCSTPVDFSGYAQSAPNGLVLVVSNVQGEFCWYNQNCNTYSTIQSGSCWQMDLEVSVDGTQSI